MRSRAPNSQLRATEQYSHSAPTMVSILQALFYLTSLLSCIPCAALHEICDSEESSAAEMHDVSLLQTNLAVQPKLSKVESPEFGVSPAKLHPHFSRTAKKLPDWMPATTAELIHHTKEGIKAVILIASGSELERTLTGPDLQAGMFDVLGLLAVSLLLFAAAQFLLPYVNEESRETASQWIEISLCFVLLTLAFCSYGVVQEYIMTMDYSGQRFPSSPFLIFSNRIFVIGFASVVLAYRGKAPWTDASKYASVPALTVYLASFCQYESLLYITFPTQVVFKSCKIVPTMIMSTVMNNTSHVWADYLYAVIITTCVAGFTVAAETRESDDLGPSYIGILMLCTFLIADALTSNSEKKIYNSWTNFDNVQMMFAVGFWTLLFSALTVVSTVSFGTMFAFFAQNPAAIAHVVGLSTCSSLGQYLIFYIIKHHGPVIFSIMMTVRQMFSIVLSTILFGHEMVVFQIACASLCFTVMLLRPLLKHWGWYPSEKKVPKPEVNPAAADLLPGENKGR